MAQFHIYNQTVADGTATSVVRPSDWNSVHSNLVTLSGNTAGVSTVSGTNIVYQGGSNVIVSGVQGANAATVIFSGSNQSVQTQVSGNIAGIGYTSTTQAGSTVGATHNTAGLSMAWPPFLTTAQAPGAYLTTAMQSNESHVQNIIAGTNATGGTASLSNNVSFSNANGVSFFTSAGNAIVATVATNYQSQGAYLTTARASNDAVGLATAQTNVTWTVNSAGLSLNAGGYAGTTTGFTGANISGSMTHNSAGLALSLSAAAGGGGADGVNIVQIGTTGTTGTSFSSSNGTVFFNGSNNITVSQNNSNQIVIVGPNLTQFLTTAAQSSVSNVSGILAATNNTGGGTATLSGNISFSNANGVSFFTSAGNAVVATVATNYQSQGAYLTTARGSTDAVGLGTAQTNVTWTVNSAGLSLNAGGYAGTTTGFTGANISGSMTHNSAGLALSLSVAAGGGGADGGNTLAVAGSTAGSNSLVLFSNSPTVTFGMAGNTITASAAGGGGGGGVTLPGYEVFQLNNATTFSSAGQNSIYFQKFMPVGNVSFNNIERRISGSSVSSAIAVNVNHTIDYGMYSLQTGASSTQYSLIASSQMIIQASYSSNLSAGYTISQGAASRTSTSAGTVVMGDLTGFKHFYMPFTSTITAGGAYAVAMRISSATTGNTGAFRMALKEMSNFNNLTIGKLYATTVLATNASFVGDFAQGVYSATSSNLPNTMALSGLTNQVSQARMYLQFDV